MCVEKPEAKELNFGVNLLRDQRVLKLPSLWSDKGFLPDGATVELVAFESGNYSIECFGFPIRFGKYFGNRVLINSWVDTFEINPKFVFDANRKVWTLMNCGYVCFAEQELECHTNHKLWGIERA